MKIGRNEPCPCGSGKKYKKCCLNKETSYLDIINNDKQDKDAFPGMDDKVKKLIPILKEYSIFDLIKSIFCINSWIVNRSALCNAFALNKSLTLIETFGTKEIKTYKDFCEFF